MSIELLGNVTPILMIGESHSLAFKNLLFHPTWSKETFICRNRFLPSLLGSQFSINNSMNQELVEILVAEGILDRMLRPAYLYADPSVSYIAGTPVLAPPLVFFGCDTEMVFLFSKLVDKFDFDLPEDPGYGIDRNKQPITYTEIAQQVATIVDPFISAVRQLHSVGFSRIMVHCIPPRNIDEVVASAFTSGVVVPMEIRSKLVLLANRMLRTACDEMQIVFIDIWPETSENGYLKPEFALDGVHLNRAAAKISLDKIAMHLFNCTGSTFNTVRYAQLAAQADLFNTSNVNTNTWNANGWAAGRLADEDVAILADHLAFNIVQGNPHARTDWGGWPLSGRQGIAMAEPDESALTLALKMLGQNEGRAILHTNSEHELTVISFRPVKFSSDNDSLSLCTLPLPPNGRRALLQLSKGNDILFESCDDQIHEVPDVGYASLVVYDPAHIRYRLLAGENEKIIIEMVLIPRLSQQPFRLVWAGLEEWPADPFQFSVLGMHALPSYTSDTFSARAQWL